MGLLRLLLALSVVSAHVIDNPFFYLVGGTVAVKTFYIISGFYMAMIINNYKNNISFFKSRYLRLFPVYFICVMIAFYLGNGETAQNQKLFNNDQIPLTTHLFLAFTNIFIFFQDLVMFISVNGGEFSFTSDFKSSNPPLHYFLFVPQGWALGLELSFYMLAPLMIKKKNIKLIILLILLSLTLRLLLIFFGYKDDPWTYRFFPSELALFLLGSLGYHFFSDLNIRMSKIKIYLIYILIIIFTFGYSFIGLPGRSIIYFSLVAFSLWFVFQETKNNKIDMFLGELSYPVYCSHLLINNYIFNKINFLKNNDLIFFTPFVKIFIIIIISAIIYFLIQIPVDKYRKVYKKLV
jgi:peptidoglycan/LPS O-acetylase OafA/YrhL